MSELGVGNLSTRMTYLGGHDPIDRMRSSKLQSLNAALLNSYQSALIQKYDGIEYQCLINPDNLRPDYDNKIISIDSEANMQAGDTFYWPANGTRWIIYLQELTETAYFRAYIRRCRYSLTIEDSVYYVYIQGPTEANIQWTQKAGIAYNELNYSLTMYVARTTDSLAFFRRFTTLELDGQKWEIKAVDNISMEGLIEVNLGESFNNSLEDLQSVPSIIPVNEQLPHIDGEAFVKPYDTETYTIANAQGGTWAINNSLAIITESDTETVTVEVVTGKSGSFNLVYTDENDVEIPLTVTIESF